MKHHNALDCSSLECNWIVRADTTTMDWHPLTQTSSLCGFVCLLVAPPAVGDALCISWCYVYGLLGKWLVLGER